VEFGQKLAKSFGPLREVFPVGTKTDIGPHSLYGPNPNLYNLFAQ